MSGLSSTLADCPHCGEQHGETQLKCPQSDRPLDLRGRLLEGKFRFKKPLGEGGMASVWLAVNESLERDVAIKFLHNDVTKNQEAVERFQSEARATARIGSEHIVEVYDCGESPLGPYMIMEALVGEDLSELIDKRTVLPAEEIVPIMIDVLEGLGAAHCAGIVHRDLKPGNIFLHYPIAGKAQVKLMDFGVSKFMDGSGPVATRKGLLLGTPEYMAPEQLQGAGLIDQRADVFSAGAVLYRALTDEFVYRGENLQQILVSMANDEVRRVDLFMPGLPPKLIEVIHRALERNPEDRYPTAYDMATALREVMAPLDSESSAGVAAPLPVEPDESGQPAVAVAIAPDTTQRRSKGGPFVLFGLVALIAAGAATWLAQRAPELPADTPLATVASVQELEEPEPAAAPVPEPKPEPEPEPAAAPEPEPELVLEDDEPQTPEELEEVQLIEDNAEDETPPASEPESQPENKAPRPSRPDAPPPGAFLVGDMLTLATRASSNTHAGARRYCAGLSNNQHLGLSGWRLPNPTEARKLIGNRSVKIGTYWTSAIWKGKALAFKLPKGKKSSEKATKKAARPLCVLSW